MGFEVDPDRLAAARAGDGDAFRDLVRSISKDVYNMAYRVTFNEADACDLSQEIFVTLYRNLRRYDPARPFAPWIRRVVANAAVNFRRRRRPLRALPESVSAPRSAEGLGEEEIRLVEESIRELPVEYRMVVALHYYQGLDVAAVAHTMSVPVGTVKTWLFRARGALRRKLSNRFQVGAS